MQLRDRGLEEWKCLDIFKNRLISWFKLNKGELRTNITDVYSQVRMVQDSSKRRYKLNATRQLAVVANVGIANLPKGISWLVSSERTAFRRAVG